MNGLLRAYQDRIPSLERSRELNSNALAHKRRELDVRTQEVAYLQAQVDREGVELDELRAALGASKLENGARSRT